MKKYIIALIVGLLPYITIGLWYWDFNIANWCKTDRVSVFILSILFCALSYCIYRYRETLDNEN